MKSHGWLPLATLRNKFENPALPADSLKAIFEKRTVRRTEDVKPIVSLELFNVPYEVRILTPSGAQTKEEKFTVKVNAIREKGTVLLLCLGEPRSRDGAAIDFSWMPLQKGRRSGFMPASGNARGFDDRSTLEGCRPDLIKPALDEHPGMTSDLQPSTSKTSAYLGRCPRLVSRRTFGPPFFRKKGR